MDNEDKIPLQGLTIYLIKEGYDTAESIIDDQKKSDEHELSDIGDLFVQTGWRKPPRWARFFEGYVPIEQLGFVESAAAILIMESQKRLFAITFGQGRYLLKPGCWEERFGLRVALNSIGETNIRSIDKLTFDSISRHSKEQASRDVAAIDFGLDIEQDLLRAVTGKPREEGLGRKLYGMDALHVSVQVSLNSLDELLSRYYEKYLDKSYQNLFPWVDHIGEITDRSRAEQLDNLLITRIIEGELDRIWMAVPDVVEWERIDGFRFGSGHRLPLINDINLPYFLNSLKDKTQLSKKILTTHKVHGIDNDGRIIYSWQAYHCIHAELEHEGDAYLLNRGKWYRIERDFVMQVNESYSRIPRYQNIFPEYNDASETAYNERIAKIEPSKYALMDRKTIPYGGTYNKVEFCDLFVNRQDIIHIKRYGASSVLSHLFSQGLVSGELFFTDAEFRQKVNEHLPEGHRLTEVKKRPNTDEFQIVFAVISDAPGDLVIPFFSRLNCRHAARRLEGYGYRISICKIDVDKGYSRLQRFV